VSLFWIVEEVIFVIHALDVIVMFEACDLMVMLMHLLPTPRRLCNRRCLSVC